MLIFRNEIQDSGLLGRETQTRYCYRKHFLLPPFPQASKRSCSGLLRNQFPCAETAPAAHGIIIISVYLQITRTEQWGSGKCSGGQRWHFEWHHVPPKGKIMPLEHHFPASRLPQFKTRSSLLAAFQNSLKLFLSGPNPKR